MREAQLNIQVGTVMRLHDPECIPKLELALQSLHGQVGVRVQPIVVTQRFDDAALAAVQSAVERQWFGSARPKPVVINVRDGDSGDIRSKLMNEGIRSSLATGNRFLAFLDYDDLLYSHAYKILARPLVEGAAAISFARVEVARAVALHDYDFIHRLDNPYLGQNKLDLLRDNFCPLHSYLVDTSKVPHSELYFRQDLNRLEDYDFLLRVAGRYPCDFSHLNVNIGLYIMRSNGSNSTPIGNGTFSDLEKVRFWTQNRQRLSVLRASYEVRFFASDF